MISCVAVHLIAAQDLSATLMQGTIDKAITDGPPVELVFRAAMETDGPVNVITLYRRTIVKLG